MEASVGRRTNRKEDESKGRRAEWPVSVPGVPIFIAIFFVAHFGVALLQRGLGECVLGKIGIKRARVVKSLIVAAPVTFPRNLHGHHHAIFPTIVGVDK